MGLPLIIFCVEDNQTSQLKRRILFLFIIEAVFKMADVEFSYMQSLLDFVHKEVWTTYFRAIPLVYKQHRKDWGKLIEDFKIWQEFSAPHARCLSFYNAPPCDGSVQFFHHHVSWGLTAGFACGQMTFLKDGVFHIYCVYYEIISTMLGYALVGASFAPTLVPGVGVVAAVGSSVVSRGHILSCQEYITPRIQARLQNFNDMARVNTFLTFSTD